MAAKRYTGPVCYRDGWHWSTTVDEHGHEQPDKRLVLEDDGGYRVATDADTQSWHDRTHGQFVTVDFEDGVPGLRMRKEDADAVLDFLARRDQDGGQQ